ncbi:hypothetical protein FHR83_005527 [Actinoplanes campanulatus]|jgi:hypothetical protein|uniref:Lsr2 protein n=1 Tax=Actinoplanes campanulatus TaxID=113559 RepID=A0A7W5AK93_9ACTN|nr:Lsr2 family protein [Actinoplanes campanulatus]MBB3097843.1 hypothetical protein [Actinoplanes campanulatus]GGN38591.1 protein lsr2 precursor [Actinoplanes campanulatus]GID39589.1 protein lsr2 precursor [Actinoplanes campanulatus]
MAKQIITVLTDDLNGEAADRTVEFALDGISYTIDLSDLNIGKLRKALEPYIAAGTRHGRVGGGSGRRSPARMEAPVRRSGRDENKAIREWAASNGHNISSRGRIPTEVVQAYQSR